MWRASHIVVAAMLSVVIWRSLHQQWVSDNGSDALVAGAVSVALPLASAGASVLAVAAGWSTRRPERLFAHDALSLAAFLVCVLVLSLGPLPRDVAGIFFVLAVAARFAPTVFAIAASDAPGWLVAATSFGVYASLAAWLQVSSLLHGDQAHYVMAADLIGRGSVDAGRAYANSALFHSLAGTDISPADLETHVIRAPAGERLVQGYTLPALLVPGWLVAGRMGEHLTIALIAALASWQLYELLRETVSSRPLRGGVWAAAAFLPPFLPMATHVYPNGLGALAIAAGYRLAFTAARPRLVLAGLALGSTLLLTPRDGLVLLALAPFVLVYRRAGFARFVIGAAAMLALEVALDAVLYGTPLPYAGYLFGTTAAEALDKEPSLSFRFWYGLPAILFDRTFGLAGTAPWLFLAALGIAPALRSARRLVLPAAAAIGATLLALSLFRYWEGGYAPPGRYYVEVVPLAAPLVAFGLAAARTWPLRLFAGAALAMSALAGLVISAVPTRALNTAFDGRIQDVYDVVLAANPLGWLPNFQPIQPDWYVAAYLRAFVAAVGVIALVWIGRRVVDT
ncbi:MAG: hypothetical protein M3O91_07455 [Chloroflexota bacterium]|nr:hypothetical protein [Chloroflexota bacterium]